MLYALDESLGKLIKEQFPKNILEGIKLSRDDLKISFETPYKGAIAERPAINLFLYEVRENIDLRNKNVTGKEAEEALQLFKDRIFTHAKNRFFRLFKQTHLPAYQLLFQAGDHCLALAQCLLDGHVGHRVAHHRLGNLFEVCVGHFEGQIRLAEIPRLYVVCGFVWFIFF